MKAWRRPFKRIDEWCANLARHALAVADVMNPCFTNILIRQGT